jgi:VWFA-related protein
MSTLVIMTAIWACDSRVSAQGQAPPTQEPDVVRVDTKLVQTDVMVFDKQGTFIRDLKREQFVLKIDGKPRDISFFEQVRAGSRNEEAQLASARGGAAATNGAEKGSVVPLDRGRMIFFFVDDIHMDASNVVSVRTLLLRFIERDLGQNDQAAIVNASGTIGFLQQLTNNKAVLRAAVDRLKSRSGLSRDLEYPPMSEYQALQIDRSEGDTFGYFVEQYMRNNPGISRSVAEDAVHLRASQLLQQASSLTTRTLSSLESLTRSVAQIGGRKLIFLLTDGFFIDSRNSDTLPRLRAVTSAAGRSGSVIYSIDTRGLIASLTDASTNLPADPSGRLSRGGMGEIGASQDAMNALAQDTGGRGFYNNNSLSASVTTALKESSVYYLLAWRPENEEQSNSKFRRIEVRVAGRSDLVVRFRSGFGDVSPSSSTANVKTKDAATPKTPTDSLRTALNSTFPRTALPISVTLHFLNYPERGPIVSTSLKIMTDKTKLEAVGGTPTIDIDLGGAIFSSDGKAVGSFSKHLALKANLSDAKATPPDFVFYNHFFDAKPGLYQVRVAALDSKQGSVGSATEWIEVPDLATKTLTLSSLVVGERRSQSQGQLEGADLGKQGGDPDLLSAATLNVDHHFARSSFLRFLTFVYNASGTSATSSSGTPPNNEGPTTDASANTVATGAKTGARPDLALQVQIFRDDEPVFTDPLHRISTEGIADLTRLPYAAELNLSHLQPGRYVLQVTVIDRLARTSAFQRFNFEVD